MDQCRRSQGDGKLHIRDSGESTVKHSKTPEVEVDDEELASCYHRDIQNLSEENVRMPNEDQNFTGASSTKATFDNSLKFMADARSKINQHEEIQELTYESLNKSARIQMMKHGRGRLHVDTRCRDLVEDGYFEDQFSASTPFMVNLIQVETIVKYKT